MTMEWDIIGNDGTHPYPKGGKVVGVEYPSVTLPDSAKETFGNRMIHIQSTAWKEILCRLVKQETQRPEIHQSRRMVSKVEKLDIAAIVNTELQSLRHIVDLGRDDGIRPVELKLRQHLKQGRPFIEFLRRLGVDAINLNHSSLFGFLT
jgi:hypothetical protein